MKTRVKWLDHMSFVGESASGHSVVMDGAADDGGRNLGIRPMEMVLLGLGGCTAFDVVLILKKARQGIEDCIVELEPKRADTVPRVFTEIHIHYILVGAELAAAQVERAVKLSAEKYCSVSKMLGTSVKITHSHEVRNGK